MSFIETPSFPTNISLDAMAGPSWAVQVAENQAGVEVRNALWSYPRQRFDISLTAMNATTRNSVLSFIRAIARGKLNGFRMKDWSDFECSHTDSEAGLGVVTAISATTFQLYKRYTSGGTTIDRIIQKPVSATVQIKQGAAIMSSGSHYTLDATTGILTIVGSPTPAPTTWSGEFDVPVRLDMDSAQLRTLFSGVADWGSVSLVEVRV